MRALKRLAWLTAITAAIAPVTELHGQRGPITTFGVSGTLESVSLSDEAAAGAIPADDKSLRHDADVLGT